MALCSSSDCNQIRQNDPFHKVLIVLGRLTASVLVGNALDKEKSVYEDISGWLHTLLALSRDFKREHGC